jgi:hypothetical protein
MRGSSNGVTADPAIFGEVDPAAGSWPAGSASGMTGATVAGTPPGLDSGRSAPATELTRSGEPARRRVEVLIGWIPRVVALAAVPPRASPAGRRTRKHAGWRRGSGARRWRRSRGRALANAQRSDAGWVTARDRLHGRVVDRRPVVEMAPPYILDSAVNGRATDPDPRRQRACPRSPADVPALDQRRSGPPQSEQPVTSPAVRS